MIVDDLMYDIGAMAQKKTCIRNSESRHRGFLNSDLHLVKPRVGDKHNNI